MKSIMQMLATAIRGSEPLTTEQCVRALSEYYSEGDVLAELDARRKLQSMGVQGAIYWDAADELWCLGAAAAVCSG